MRPRAGKLLRGSRALKDSGGTPRKFEACNVRSLMQVGENMTVIF